MDAMLQASIELVIQSGLLMRAKAHMWHLQTSSYSKHISFEELYTTLGEDTDKLAEIAQGGGLTLLKQGTVFWRTEFTPAEEYQKDLDQFLAQLQAVCDELSGSGSVYGYLKNVIEEFQGHLRQIYYKLQRLS